MQKFGKTFCHELAKYALRSNKKTNFLKLYLHLAFVMLGQGDQTSKARSGHCSGLRSEMKMQILNEMAKLHLSAFSTKMCYCLIYTIGIIFLCKKPKLICFQFFCFKINYPTKGCYFQTFGGNTYLKH
jgi:hypothetical protein